MKVKVREVVRVSTTAARSQEANMDDHYPISPGQHQTLRLGSEADEVGTRGFREKQPLRLLVGHVTMETPVNWTVFELSLVGNVKVERGLA